MSADTYAWYLSAGYANGVSPPAPSAAEIAVAIALAIGLVALFVVVLMWTPQVSSPATPLPVESVPMTRAERRALAQIEHSLEVSDPDLARLLTGAASGTRGR
jgi:hypothetical protein